MREKNCVDASNVIVCAGDAKKSVSIRIITEQRDLVLNYAKNIA